MKKQLTAVAFAMACAVSTHASADVLEQVDMTFQSGATFDGIVTFADDFSAATAVTGTLTGGTYGTQSVGWIDDLNIGNLSTGDANYSTMLVTGTALNGPSDDFIQLAINYSDPSQLTFTAGQSAYGTDNFIDFYDAFSSGTITEIVQPPPVTAVPELSTARMLACGLIVLVAAGLRRKRVR